MVEDTDPQAGGSKIAKRTKRGRKAKTIQQVQAENVAGKVDEELYSDSGNDENGKQYNFCTLERLLEPVPTLTVSGRAPET
ncbi:hypothetical protein NDA18_000806 [Ustilago nuda]|nr:hypothetical protein NDA18_000806 [Ustilago nuda]